MSRLRTIASILLFSLLMVSRLEAAMVITSLNGAVTSAEIDSYVTFMQSHAMPVSNFQGAMGHRSGGDDMESLGVMYSFTRDSRILDLMVQWADHFLSARNDPNTGEVMWTGNRELCWPTDSPVGYIGCDEIGHVVGHMEIAALEILKNPAIWNLPVSVGDPNGYGTTYLDRAKTYIREGDVSMDFYFPWQYVRTGTNREYWPPDARFTWGKGQIPYNQQAMMNTGFIRLAQCHQILGDNAALVTKYQAVIQAAEDWFLSALTTYQAGGVDVYKWYYIGVGPSYIENNSAHSSFDILGAWRAYQDGNYGISATTMTGFAETLKNVIYLGNNQFSGNVDGTGNTQASMYSEWLYLSEFDPCVYPILGNTDLAKAKNGPIYEARLLWVKNARSTGLFPINCGTSDFTLSGPGMTTITAGNSGTLGLKVNPLSGFTGTVSFTASGLPSGVTAGFNPSTVSGGTGSTTLTLSISGGVAAGIYPITVTGVSGGITRVWNLTLIVKPGPTPTFTRTRTRTFTPTATRTKTPTATFSITATPSRTFTLTASPTRTSTGTATPSATASRTPTSTGTATSTFTSTRTFTSSSTATSTSTRSMTPTGTATPSATRTGTPSLTTTPVPPTLTSTATTTRTGTFTSTRTNTPVPPTLTFTGTSSATASPTSTRTLTPTGTGTASTTATSSPTLTASPTTTRTATPSQTPSATRTRTPSLTATPVPPTATLTNTLVPPTDTTTFTSTTTPTPVPPTVTPTRTASTTTTSTSTGTNTATRSPTPSATRTGTPSLTTTPVPLTVTATATTSATASWTPTSTTTLTWTRTATPVPPTATLTSTLVPPTATTTFSSTFTSTRTFTASATTTRTPTSTSTDSMTPTASLTASWTPSWTATPSHTATRTPVPPTATRTSTPIPNCSGIPAWSGNSVSYKIGDKVVYGGRLYQCQQAHTSLSNWTPPATPALWVDLGACPGFPLTQLTVASVTSDPNPTTGGTTNLVYQVSSPSAGAYAGQTVSGARVYLKIYTVAERLVWSQVFGESEASTGEHKVLWDCRDRMGSSLANGVYYFSVTVEVKDQRNTKLTPLLILK